MESFLGEIGVIRGGRYNIFALLGKCLMSVCTHYGFSRTYFQPLLLFGISLILLRNCV